MDRISKNNNSIANIVKSKNDTQPPRDEIKGKTPRINSDQIDKTKGLREHSIKPINKFKPLDGSPISQIERFALKWYPSDSYVDASIEEIKSILRKNPGLSIDEVMEWDWDNVTPLMAATANGCSKMCVELIKKLGANPFVQDSMGKNLLHLIIAKGHCEDRYMKEQRENQIPLFNEVLKHESIEKHINVQDVFGLTPLHYACARRSKIYIEKLVIYGANPNIKDINGKNCFDILKLDEQSRVNLIALALSVNSLDTPQVSLTQSYQIIEGLDYCIYDPLFEKLVVGSFNADHRLTEFSSPVEKENFNIDPTDLLKVLEFKTT